MSGKYAELRQALPTDLLDAVVYFYHTSTYLSDYEKVLVEKMLRLGFELAQHYGWRQVAPQWLEDWRLRDALE